MKFLLDVNMPPQLAASLSKIGHEARHVSLEGFPKASDFELLEIAKLENEVILTHDLDFGQLLAFTGYRHPSVVIFRIHQINAGMFERLLLSNWHLLEQSLIDGSVIIIEEEKIRIKKLPI